MNGEQFEQIMEKLDQVVGLLAIQGREQLDQIRVLYSLGFDSPGIAKLTGLNAVTIRRYKQQLKSRRS